jgi:hypothetical protein
MKSQSNHIHNPAPLPLRGQEGRGYVKIVSQTFLTASGLEHQFCLIINGNLSRCFKTYMSALRYAKRMSMEAKDE